MSKPMTLREYIQVEWVTNYGKVLNTVSPWTAAHLSVEVIEALGQIIKDAYDPAAKPKAKCLDTFNTALTNCPSLACYSSIANMYGLVRSAFAHAGCSALAINNADTENLTGPNYVLSAKLLYQRVVDACNFVCSTYPERVDILLISAG